MGMGICRHSGSIQRRHDTGIGQIAEYCRHLFLVGFGGGRYLGALVNHRPDVLVAAIPCWKLSTVSVADLRNWAAVWLFNVLSATGQSATK